MHPSSDPSRSSPGSPGGPGKAEPPRAASVPDPVEALVDLESRAAAWSREERAAEVLDRAVEAYRGVTLVARLVASLGREVSLDLGAAGRVRGVLAGAGDGWAEVGVDRTSLVMTDAVQAVTGLADGAAAAAAWPPASRRSLGTVLQRRVQAGGGLEVVARDGTRRRARGLRVGADFLELRTDDGASLVLPTAMIGVVRGP